MATCIDNTGVTYKRGDATEKSPRNCHLVGRCHDHNVRTEKLASAPRQKPIAAVASKVRPEPDHFQLSGIFVVGDLAAAQREDGKLLPGVAQVCHSRRHLRRKSYSRPAAGQKDMPPFHYFDKGDMAVIGRAAAVANVFGCTSGGCPLGSFGCSFISCTLSSSRVASSSLSNGDSSI